MEHEIRREKDREGALPQMPLVSDEVTCGGKNGGAAREEGSPIVSLPPMSVLHTCMDLVNAPIMEEVVVEGLDLKSVGPVFEGSTTEIVNIHGSRRKVRLLSDVIQSVLSPEERELPAKYSSKKGRGRLRKKVVSSSVVANISLSDSYLHNRKEAILKEAASTVDFGKLLGVKTIGREDVIVQDIARIIVNSQ
ncbi:hypothetical protein V6N13_043925 [Hibiscus sabdariffa]